MKNNEPIYVILATADWDATLWTNKQHTARALRDNGYQVFYVESMGLRPPTFSSRDFRRLLRRLRRIWAIPRIAEENLMIWSPLSIPLQGYRSVRFVNRLLVSLLLERWTAKLANGGPRIYLTYNPLTLELVKLPARKTLVYHCVDDISAQPGMPATLVDQCEAKLVKEADIVFVSSPNLRDKWSKLRQVHYLPNCVDYDHFATAATQEPDDLRNTPRPRIGFAGALADYKVDFSLLITLAQTLHESQIILVGPIEGSSPELDRLRLFSNVSLLGAKSYQELPSYMQAFDVGIIPAHLNQYTRSMFPMKFFEYLAAGIPVVTTDLHALTEYEEIATVVPSKLFVEAVQTVLRSGGPPLEIRVAVAQSMTYEARTQRMLKLIESVA